MRNNARNRYSLMVVINIGVKDLNIMLAGRKIPVGSNDFFYCKEVLNMLFFNLFLPLLPYLMQVNRNMLRSRLQHLFPLESELLLMFGACLR